MSLRLRLFLLLGSLVALLVAGQWWMVRALSQDLAVEVGNVAVTVGQSLLTAVGSDGEPVVKGTRRLERRVTVLHEPSTDPDATGPGAADPKTGHEFAFKILTQDDERNEETTTEDQESEMLEGHVVLPPGTRTAKTSIVLHMDEKRGRLVVEDGGEPQLIPIPEHGIHRKVERFGNRLLAGSLLLLGLGVLAAAVVAHRVSAPLGALAAAARRVGEGELGVQSPEPGEPEVAEAVRAFNRMSGRLAVLEEESRRMRERGHLAELGEIARGLAHTLRNPLNALGLTVEELARLGTGGAADGSAGGEAAELADAARRQIRRIDGSVRSLLVLAAEGAGAAASEAIDLVALVQDVALEALQDSRGRVRIEVHPPALPGPGPPLRLAGVAAELRAMVQALVVNAVEASPADGTVEAQVEAFGEGARIRVLDAGPGLPREVRERLFAAHVTTKPTGSGMGLFLCHRLATSRYGGTLELRDRAGGGTEAVLALDDRAGDDRLGQAATGQAAGENLNSRSNFDGALGASPTGEAHG